MEFNSEKIWNLWYVIEEWVLEIRYNLIQISSSFFFNLAASIPSFFNKADRIVGGKDAPSNIPWQVSIRQGLKSEMHHSVYHSKWLGRGNHWCGGTILDSWTVLSAAHCFFDAKNEEGIYGGREYVKKIQPYIKVGSINDVAEEAEAQVPIKSDKIFVRHQLDNI